MRHYTKWDDEPGSVEAALESIVRAHQIATTPPFGPTFVVRDVDMQEQPLPEPLPMPQPERLAPPSPTLPAPADVKRAVEIMRAAAKPLMIVGRTSRDLDAYNARVALAETLGARVITDFKAGSVFPTAHPLHVDRSAARLTKAGLEAVREADAILSLEAIDLGGILKQAFGVQPPSATIVNCSIDRYVHNGWSMDHQSLPPADLLFSVVTDHLVAAMLAELGRPARPPAPLTGPETAPPANGDARGEMAMPSFCDGVQAAFAGRDV